MKFITEVKVPVHKDLIAYHKKMLALGSCFAVEIGRRLSDLQFDIQVNPGGTIFNPLSLAEMLNNSMSGEINDSLVVENSGRYYHYGYHSSIHAFTSHDLKARIQSCLNGVNDVLQNSDVLLVTFGTAFVYHLLEYDISVANCHKQPQNLFCKKMLTVDSIVQSWSTTLNKIKSLNPRLNVVFTVSPVRHLKDGLHENNLSKSILLLAVNELCKLFADWVVYFPAYELVIDELRDYRFYKEDMLHPTGQACDYVFEKMRASCFSDKTIQGVSIQREIMKLRQHIPMSDTASQINEKLAELNAKFAALRIV